jgi:internalin A
LSGLTQVPALTSLNLSGNQIGVVGDLSPLTHVAVLDLSNNAIYDISNLIALPSLRDVNLSGNQVSDVSGLANGNELYDLNLQGNQISELGQFLKLSWWPGGNYGAEAILDVSDNPIDCTAQAANIKAIRALQIGLIIDCP